MNTLNEIYNLTYSPLLTPYNLLDNLNLENYYSINYSKKENNIIAEIICSVDSNIQTFYYLFDKNQFLKQIYYFEKDEKEFLFNREEELEEARNEYIKHSKILTKCV